MEKDKELLEKEYASVIKQIEELQNRKLEIEEKLILQTDDFMTKFRLWYLNDDEGYHQWIVDSPILRKLLNNIDPRRGETIELGRLIGYEEFDLLVYPEDSIKYYETPEDFKAEYDRVFLKYQPALQEAMDTNMKEFKCDW